MSAARKPSAGKNKADARSTTLSSPAANSARPNWRWETELNGAVGGRVQRLVLVQVLGKLRRRKNSHERNRLHHARNPTQVLAREKQHRNGKSPKTTRESAREQQYKNGTKPDASTCRKRAKMERQIPTIPTRFRTAAERQAHLPQKAARPNGR